MASQAPGVELHVADLAGVPEPTLARLLGPSLGAQLARLARGEDPRPVEAWRPVKSIGHEQTFPADLHSHLQLRPQLWASAEAVADRLHRGGLAGRTSATPSGWK